jgi:hypothetical protein
VRFGIGGGRLVARAKAEAFVPPSSEMRVSFRGQKTKAGSWEVKISRIEPAARPLPYRGFQGFRYVRADEQPTFRKGFVRTHLHRGTGFNIRHQTEPSPGPMIHDVEIRLRLWLNRGETVRWPAAWGPVGIASLEDNGETLVTEVRIDRHSLVNGLSRYENRRDTTPSNRAAPGVR